MMNRILDNDMMNKPDKGNGPISNLNQFKSSQVSFNENNVQLIRNRFIYKTLNYDEIIQIEIWKGYQIKNRWLMIILCLAIIISSCYFTMYSISRFGGLTKVSLSGWFNRGSMLSFWGPAILICFAATGIVSAFVKSHVATIVLAKKEIDVRIKRIDDKKLLPSLVSFLEEKIDVILKID